MVSPSDKKPVLSSRNVLQERQQMWKSFTKFGLYVAGIILVLLALMRIFLIP